MAVEKLAFNPASGWNDQTVFPDNPDAADVRPLFQRLHDQTRDYINNVVSPAIDAAVLDIAALDAEKVSDITGSGAARITRNGNTVNVAVTGTGGDMLMDNYANGTGKANPNTVDHAIDANRAALADAVTPDFLTIPPVGTTTNVGNAYSVVTTPAPSVLADGMGVIIKCNADSTGPASLNWGGLGAHNIVDGDGVAISDLKANAFYCLRYNGVTGNFTLQGKGGGLKINGTTETQAVADGAVAKGDQLTGGFGHIKMADPVSLPPTNVLDTAICAFGSDLYIAVVHSTTPYVTTYKLTAGAWVKIANPTSLPPNVCKGVSLCVYASELYLAVAHTSTPYVTTYKLVAGAWSKIADPASLPLGTSGGVKVSLCVFGIDIYLAHLSVEGTYSYPKIYKLVAGAWTALGGLPVGSAGVNGTCMTLFVFGAAMYWAMLSTASWNTYKYESGSWAAIPQPSVTPPGNWSGGAFCVSGGDLYFAVAHSNTPFISVYKLVDGTWEKLPKPTVLPVASAISVAAGMANSDGYLAVGSSAAPWLSIYRLSTDRIVSVAAPGALPPAKVNGVAFCLFGASPYLAAGHDNSPFVMTYSSVFKVAAQSGPKAANYNPSSFLAIAKAAAADAAPITAAVLRS